VKTTSQDVRLSRATVVLPLSMTLWVSGLALACVISFFVVEIR
jgi:disulfide bond formation protein DsbB